METPISVASAGEDITSIAAKPSTNFLISSSVIIAGRLVLAGSRPLEMGEPLLRCGIHRSARRINILIAGSIEMIMPQTTGMPFRQNLAKTLIGARPPQTFSEI
jgi:hypothetical protein